MTLKEYIESGMLDAYALDALSKEESAAVEAMLEQFPELREELAQIEAALGELAFEEAKAPPSALKATIWEALSTLPPEMPAVTPKAATEPVRTIDFKPVPKRFSWSMAAAVAGLLLSLAGNIYLYQHRQSALQEMAFLNRRIGELESENGQVKQQLVTYQEQTSMLTEPDMQRVMMKSPDAISSARAAVLIVPQSKTAFVALHNMPKLPAGKQYQLWVLKGGKPSSMGVIPNRALEGGAEPMILPVTGGEAYAISLEKEGGVVSPTMSQIQVLGTAS